MHEKVVNRIKSELLMSCFIQERGVEDSELSVVITQKSIPMNGKLIEVLWRILDKGACCDGTSHW